MRAEVQKELERLRVKGDIGSSLAAEVEVAVDRETHAVLQSLGEDLRLVLLTSAARAIEEQGEGVRVRAVPSKQPKCVRCWHYRADVGADPQHAGICGRCVANLHGSGEVRRYA